MEIMELLSLLIFAKMSASPLATGLYRFEWKRAWVEGTPPPRVLFVEDESRVEVG